ncbi:MAG TPA: hypothetical protein PLE19_24015 [Planctomycetota bacterium]|nr:hypothetical protein [Planctomycetota bacterium]HRR83130.1 hypothetical protein [Planctomycetota bacterium]
MRYDPQTVYAAARAWYLAQPGLPPHVAASAGHPHQLYLAIYVRGDEEGHYHLAGPRLYRVLEGEDGQRNCSQDALREAAGSLGHVILRHRASRDERFWPTWRAFAEEVGLASL